jgi:hypothetical protein
MTPLAWHLCRLRRPHPVAFLVVAAWLATPATARAFDPLQRGTKQLGGTLTLEIEEASTTHDVMGYRIAGSPGVGYFVADGLELRAGLGLDYPFGPLHASAGLQASAFLGVRWFGRLGPSSAVYVGLEAGPGLDFLRAAGTSVSLGAALPAGLLFWLSPSLALDVGARLEHSRNVHNGSGSMTVLRFGSFGIQGFFE